MDQDDEKSAIERMIERLKEIEREKREDVPSENSSYRTEWFGAR